MLLHSLIYMILSTASLTKRDLSITLSRIVLSNLLLIGYINYNSIHSKYLEKGIGLYNGLYQTNTNCQVFDLFLILLSYCILMLTSFYPRKLDDTGHVNSQEEEIKAKLEIIEETPKQEQLATTENITETQRELTNIVTPVNLNDKSISTGKNETNEADKNSVMKKSGAHYTLDKESRQFKILEYSLLILFVLCGAIFLMSINDIISIFISIELQSYGLYLLSSVYRDSESSTRAGLTYFLLGGLSSCFILLSQGLIYINSGNTNLENIYVLCNINALSTDIFDTTNDYTNIVYNQFYINMSLIILSIGFLFKVSAAPFHFWSPDVYDGVPTIVTTFIAIIAKVSILIFLLQLVHFTNNTYVESSSYSWNKNLLMSSLFSLIIGTVLGLTQFRIKRLYAYSTISHLGFILLALSINSIESIQAFIFYLIQYSISNLNAFIILLSTGYFLVNFGAQKGYTNLIEVNNSPLQLVSQVKGLYKLNVVLALSFGLTLFSFLGVPPLLGFFGKQMVLSAALDSGYIFMCLVAILTSVISAVYYLLVIKRMFFEDSDYINYTEINFSSKKDLKSYNIQHNYVRLSSSLTVIISILTLVTLVFMFVPTESLNLIKILSLFVLDI